MSMRNPHQLRTQLAGIKVEREAIGNKLQKLNAGGIDLDLLDEQAHRVLGHIGKDEVVVFSLAQQFNLSGKLLECHKPNIVSLFFSKAMKEYEASLTIKKSLLKKYI